MPRDTFLETWEDEAMKSYVLHPSIRYLRVQLEEASSEESHPGELHVQGWFYTKSPRAWTDSTRKAMQNELGMKNAHLEKMKGNYIQSETYCTKSGVPGGRIEGQSSHSFGDKPSQGNRTDLYEIGQMIKKEEITTQELMFENPAQYRQMRIVWKEMEDWLDESCRRKRPYPMPECIWVTGPTGCGKSHWAFMNEDADEGLDDGSTYEFDTSTKWWDDYKARKCKTVIINDFRGEVDFRLLMKWCDKWPCKVPVRCRCDRPMAATKFIITSIKLPEDCYVRTAENEDVWGQFNRRFTVKTMGASGPEGGGTSAEPGYEFYAGEQ